MYLEESIESSSAMGVVFTAGVVSELNTPPTGWLIGQFILRETV